MKMTKWLTNKNDYKGDKQKWILSQTQNISKLQKRERAKLTLKKLKSEELTKLVLSSKYHKSK